MTETLRLKQLTVISEERPKLETIRFVLEKAVTNNFIVCPELKNQVSKALQEHVHNRSSLKLLTTDRLDTFLLLGKDLSVPVIIVAGEGSFPDYLLYEHPHGTKPSPGVPPILAVEETKNTGDDARNMVWQRLSKLVSLRLRFIDQVVPFFLYLEKSPFGTHAPLSVKNAIRVLRTLGGELGYRENVAEPPDVGPFESVKALADALNATKANSNNTTVRLYFTACGRPTLNIRLQKGKGQELSDPNTGVLTSIALSLKKFGYTNLLVTSHRLGSPFFDTPRADKLAKVASSLNIAFACEGKEKQVQLAVHAEKPFWDVCNQEKLASIRVHMLVLERGARAGLFAIFSNHGGCEKEFYIALDGTEQELKKAKGLPDLILADDTNQILYVQEAKLASEIKKGMTSLVGEKTLLEQELPNIDPGRQSYTKAYGLLVYAKAKPLPAEPSSAGTGISLTEFVVFESAAEHWIRLNEKLALALGVTLEVPLC